MLHASCMTIDFLASPFILTCCHTSHHGPVTVAQDVDYPPSVVVQEELITLSPISDAHGCTVLISEPYRGDDFFCFHF
jgi:hypothetical protein